MDSSCISEILYTGKIYYFSTLFFLFYRSWSDLHHPLILFFCNLKCSAMSLTFHFDVFESIIDCHALFLRAMPCLSQLKTGESSLLHALLSWQSSRLCLFSRSLSDFCNFSGKFFPKVSLRFRSGGRNH